MYALAVERLHEWQPLRREVLVDEEEACRADGEWAEEGENEVLPTHFLPTQLANLLEYS